MEEDLCSKFDSFSSTNNEIRQLAERYLTEQIDNNPELYIPLFNICTNSTNFKHIKLALILLNNIISRRFNFVSHILPDFTEKLKSLIKNSKQQDLNEYYVEMVFRITFRIAVPWGDLPTFLTLYQENPKLQNFCVLLFIRCYHEENIYAMYSQILNDLDQEITLIGLHQDGKVLNRSTYHFTKLFSKVKSPEIFEKYREHYSLICQIAENSFEKMDEYNFSLFWSQFYRLPSQYLDPFFVIAMNFLETKELSTNCKIKLLQILISDYARIDLENLQTVIDTYFISLETVDDIEESDIIFVNLAKVDFNQSYELFKNNFIVFLTSNENEKQQIGLIMLYNFINVYTNRINQDISDIIDISLKIASKSEENLRSMTRYLVNYLRYNKLNYEDAEKIYSFTFEYFINQTSIDFQFRLSQIIRKLGPNPIYFDAFIESFEKIQFNSLPIYFSLLLNLHSVENNMSNEKYFNFFTFLIDKFEIGCKEFDESYQKFREDDSNQELFDSTYNYALLRNSSSNLLYLFSIFNPKNLSGYFEKSIQCFIDLLDKDELRENDGNYFGLIEIKDDFTQVFKYDKLRSIEIMKGFYDIISESQDIEELQNELLSLNDSGYQKFEEYINYFKEFENELFVRQRKFLCDELLSETKEILLPISKWLYKINDVNIHNHFLKTIVHLFRFTISSNKLLIYLTEIIKRIVKPKRMNFNQENEWYLMLCEKLYEFVKKFVLKLLPSLSESCRYQSFEALCNLMKFFMSTDKSFSHEFLTNVILPFYEEFNEPSEIPLLNLFSKMIDLNNYNQDEIGLMINIIKTIIERRKKFYLDSRPALLTLLIKISNINFEFIEQFVNFAFETFNETKDIPLLFDVKVTSACFLFHVFNKNPQKYQKEFIPLIPDIFKVFPCKFFANKFFEELKIFNKNSEELFTKEIYDAFVNTLIRYLSYQDRAAAIFDFDSTNNDELIQMFSKLIESYFQSFQFDGGLEGLLNVFLPNQPVSIQYILSLQL